MLGRKIKLALLSFVLRGVEQATKLPLVTGQLRRSVPKPQAAVATVERVHGSLTFPRWAHFTGLSVLTLLPFI